MRRVRVVLGSLVVAFLASGMLFGDDPKATPKARGSLPPNWSKLGLTDEQKQKVYAIESEYRAKIDALQQQIKALQKQQRDDLAKVLTEAQKARLKEILASKVPGDDSKSDSKGSADKK
jgi:hypothetical protein